MNNLFLSNIAEVQIIYKNKINAADRPVITCSQTAEEIFRNFWDPHSIEHTESMYLMLLNRANRVLGVTRLSSGGTSGCILDVKVVFQYALKAHACGILLSHNHPSDNRNPSDQDIQITKKVKAGGELLDIKLLDHVIITPNNGYFSMADEGII